MSRVESRTDISELPWAAATSNSEPVLPWGCSPFSPHPPQLHPGPFSKEAQKELVTPGFMWQDWASLQFSPCPKDLTVLCCPETQARGRQGPRGLRKLVPWPLQAHFVRGFWIQEGIFSLQRNLQVLFLSDHRRELLWSSGVLGPVQTAHPKTKSWS